MIKKRWILTSIMALVLVGCATTKGNWEKAQRLNTIKAYQEFLQKHPQSEFTAEAKHQIQNIDWQKATRLDTLESYQEFKNKYPHSKFIHEAEARIDKLAWQKAQGLNTIESYKEFLKKHPQSEFGRAARDRIEQLERIEQLAWEEAKGTDTVLRYKKFIEEHPSSKFVSQAKERIQRLLQLLRWKETQKKDTLSAYRQFITKYPNSKFAALAKEKIKKLEKIEEEKEFRKVIRKGSVDECGRFLTEFAPKRSFKNQIIERIKSLVKKKAPPKSVDIINTSLKCVWATLGQQMRWHTKSYFGCSFRSLFPMEISTAIVEKTQQGLYAVRGGCLTFDKCEVCPYFEVTHNEMPVPSVEWYKSSIIVIGTGDLWVDGKPIYVKQFYVYPGSRVRIDGNSYIYVDDNWWKYE